MLLFDHNFRNNGVVLRVTPKTVMLKVSSLIYLTLHWPGKVLTLIQALALICHGWFVHPCFWVILLFLETGGCDAVKAQTSADADGEYFMQIGTDCDTRVRLYCRGMRTDNPTEYISLLSGPKDNYAYVYGYKQPYASREECVKADGKFVFAFCAAIVTFYWPLGGFERMLRKLDRTSALKRVPWCNSTQL